MRTAIIISIMLVLSACGLNESIKREKESREAFLTCLEANAKTPDKCQALGMVYLTNKADLDRRNAALQNLGNQQYYTPPAQPQSQIWQQNMGGRTYNCNNFGGGVNCF